MTEWMDQEIRKIYNEQGEKKLEKSDEPFKRLLSSIISQQLSTQSAEAIRKRFFDAFEIEPQKIIEADSDKMSEVGLSGQKIEYMKSAAEQFMEDELTSEKFAEMSDEEVIEELTDIHGVGEWTAKMFLIFVLGREDVFPVEDLGIRKAMKDIYGIDSRSEMTEKSFEWRPKRSIASLYLWSHLD